jgi:hypothetical protein
MIRNAQNSICAAVEEMDGSGQKFRRDEWMRAGGGGGITAVMQVRAPGLARAWCEGWGRSRGQQQNSGWGRSGSRGLSSGGAGTWQDGSLP